MKISDKNTKEGFSFIEVMIVCIMLTFIVASLSIILDSGFSNVLYFNKVSKKNDNRKYLFKTLYDDLSAIYFDSKYKIIRKLATNNNQSSSSSSATSNTENNTPDPFSLENFGITENQIAPLPSVGIVIDNEKRFFSFVRLRTLEGIDLLKRITYSVTNQGLVRRESNFYNPRDKGSLLNFGKNITFSVNLTKRNGQRIPFSRNILKSYATRPDFFNVTVRFKEKNKTIKTIARIPFHLYPVMVVKYKADGSVESTPVFAGASAGGSSGANDNTNEAELESEDI
jgi:hypothetical protein